MAAEAAPHRPAARRGATMEERYAADGYLAPVPVLSQAEAAAALLALNQWEATLPGGEKDTMHEDLAQKFMGQPQPFTAAHSCTAGYSCTPT